MIKKTLFFEKCAHNTQTSWALPASFRSVYRVQRYFRKPKQDSGVTSGGCGYDPRGALPFWSIQFFRYQIHEKIPVNCKRTFFFSKTCTATPRPVVHFRLHSEVSTESPNTFESQSKTLGSLPEPAGRIRGERFIFGASHFWGMSENTIHPYLWMYGIF